MRCASSSSWMFNLAVNLFYCTCVPRNKIFATKWVRCIHALMSWMDLTSNASFSIPKWMTIRRRLLGKNAIFNRKIRIMQASPTRKVNLIVYDSGLDFAIHIHTHIMFNTHFIAAFASNDAIFFSRISFEIAVRVHVFTCAAFASDSQRCTFCVV